jgi:hypothetical protein
VADRADVLIASVATPDAVRIAAIATSNAGYPARCLELLECSKPLFPEGSLTNELLLLRINCQRRVGAFAKALSDAEELVAREDNPRNIIALIDVQLQKADLKGLAITARRILHRQDFRARDILRAAKLVFFEDTELAAKLWRQAVEGVLMDPSLVGEAMGLGYALGLDKEIAPLQSVMHEMADRGEGHFKSFSLTEVIKKRDHRVHQLNDIFRDYTQGKLMLHMFAAEAGATLVDWLHGFPAQNRTSVDLRYRPGIYTRHGGNSIKRSAVPMDSDVHMHMDVTALVVAAELGILDVVEETFQPIRISDSMPLALIQELNVLTPNQPTQFALNVSIVEKVESNKLQIIPEGIESAADAGENLKQDLGEFWTSVAYQALEESAYVVDHLPLRSFRDEKSIVDIPAALQTQVINCRAVADALRTHGPLSDASYADAIKELGSEASPILDASLPPAKARLYLLGASASVLADSGLLDLACEHFQLFIPASVVQFARGGVQEHAHRLEMINWVQRLIERIRDGIDHQVYEIIPIVEDLTVPPSDRRLAENYDLRTFSDLLHFKAQKGDVIWVDDRYVNGYGHREGAPIVAVTDVLKKLLTDNKITVADYYGKLLQLRRSNVRYLPLESEEILFHLRSAQLASGVVVETDELGAIRRYVAACLLDSENLQKSPQPQGSSNLFGEINFVYETTGGVIDAIVALWADESLSVEDAEARAEWLLSNLYTGRFGCAHLLPEAVAQRGDECYLVGIDIAELFAKGIGVGETEIVAEMSAEQEAPPIDTGQKGLSRRQYYFEWLKRRVVTSRVKADPGAMDAAAKVIQNVVRASSERQLDDPQEKRQVRRLMQQLYLDLPSELQRQIRQDPRLLSWVGIRVAEAIQINGIPFPPDEFWQAAEAAVNGRVGTVEGFSQRGLMRLQQSTTPNDLQFIGDETQGEVVQPAPERTVDIYDESGQLVSRFKHAMLGLMSAEVSERLRTLSANRHWFDIDQETTEREMEDIAAMHNPRERVDRANSWGKGSTATFYLGLEQKMRAKNGFQRDDLTGLEGAGLLRHYRLQHFCQSNAPFSQALSASTTLLMAEETLEATLDRLVSLPVRIADSVIEDIQKLEDEGRHALLCRFTVNHPSPLGKLHLIDLLLRTGGENEAALLQARGVVKELFNDGAGSLQFKLFKSILVSVNEEFGFRSDTSEWPAAFRLAMVWAHATNLYDVMHPIFITADKDLEELANWFSSPYRQFSVEMLNHNSAYMLDCAHPAQLRRVEFLSMGSLELLARHGHTALESIGLLEHVRHTGFEETDGMFLPLQDLLGDTSLTTNLTGSFLAGDKPALFELVGAPTIPAFVTPQNLEAIVRLQIKELSADAGDHRNWAFIASILRGHPIYRELQDDFRSLIQNIAFDQVLSANRQAAMNALVVVSEQNSVLTDTERSACESWLLKYVKAFGDRDPSRSIDEDVERADEFAEELAEIMECAVGMSVRPDDPRASGLAFSGLIRRMLDTWSGLSEHLHQALQRSVFELPVSQLHGMWLVVLTSRASRRTS